MFPLRAKSLRSLEIPTYAAESALGFQCRVGEKLARYRPAVVNASGKRISKRQYSLMRGRPLHREWNPRAGQGRERFLGNGDLPTAQEWPENRPIKNPRARFCIGSSRKRTMIIAEKLSAWKAFARGNHSRYTRERGVSTQGRTGGRLPDAAAFLYFIRHAVVK
jgi:hypothetical protein